jgi:hypothetical protein
MGAAQTSVYIQGNYLDNVKHSAIKSFVEHKNGTFTSPSPTKFGFATVRLPLSYVHESKSEIDQIINNLDGGFIRLSMSSDFDIYKEYK